MERLHETVSRFLFLCAALAGCASPARMSELGTASTVPAMSIEQGDDRSELLRYLEQVRAMPAPQLEQEARMVDSDALRDPSVANRLRLGIFLGFAPPPFRSTQRAQEVLDNAWRDEGGQQRELVRLLLAVLHDRQDLESALGDERRQRQALHNKLEQLKAIEEDLDRRMQPPVINPR